MAKEISKLFVTLGLDDKGFKSQLKQIDKQMSAMGKTMVAAGAAIVAGIGMAVKAWAAAGDEVQKMSLRTNWAAESLSELNHVAKISGTELGAFEKGTRKMSQAIIQAGDGLATYTREFDRLGLNVQELKAMKPEEAFWLIAESIAGMDNEIEMSASLLAIFGRTGTQLLPMLNEGADGIERLRQEAHDLGIVFDQEAADNAARLTDTLQRLKESFQGVTYEVAEQAAPTIESYANIITDAMKATRKLADEHPELSNALVNTGLSFGGVSLAVGGLILALPKLIQFVNAAKISVGTLSLAAGGLVAGLTLLGTGISLLIQHYMRYGDVLEAHKKLSEEHEKAMRGETNAVWEAMAAYADINEAYVRASGLSKEAKEVQYEYIRDLRQAVKAHEGYEQVLADTNAWLKEQKDLLQANRDKFMGMIESIRYAYTDISELGVTIEDITRYMLESGRGAELLGVKWGEIGDDADLLARKFKLNIKELAGGDLFAQAYQTYEKEIQALEDIADADKRAIDSRLDYYRDKIYERERLIEEAALKEIAAVDPNVAAIIEGYNTELEKLDEREKARDIAREDERIAALESQLDKEKLSSIERERIQRDLEEAKDAQQEREILEERNAEIATLNMEEYLENQKSLIVQNLEDEKALKDAALEETKADYQAELEAFVAMWDAKIEAAERANQIIQQQQQLQKLIQQPSETGEKLYPPENHPWHEIFQFPTSFKQWDPLHWPWFDEGGIVPGNTGQPVPIVAHGGEVISQPGRAGTNITQNFHISQLVVREEADVRKVARELYRMQQVRV